MDTSENNNDEISGNLPLHPDVEALIQQARTFQETGRPYEAETAFRSILALNPNIAVVQLNLGLILKQIGNLDQAAMCFKQAIKLRPDIATSHFQLAHLRNYSSSTSDIAAMKELYNKSGTGWQDKYYLAFGLGSALEKQGAYEEAFDYWLEGHEIMQRIHPFNLAEFEQHFSELKKLFDKEFVIRRSAVAATDKLPIFIVGMPRSGTTLTEQILASHSQVQGAGELDYLEDIVHQVTELSGKPLIQSQGSLSEKVVHQLGLGYLDKLRTHSKGARRVVDTTPMNFRLVGLIAMILPQAKIIHCVRDPMDTCVSIFQQPLAQTHNYANNLGDLGGFYNLYRELMASWHSFFPGKIYDINYEKLVTDNKGEISKLLEYCDLPFEQDCLQFHRTKRAVNTPSASQVRVPVYTGSIDRWKRYESKLGELRKALD